MSTNSNKRARRHAGYFAFVWLDNWELADRKPFANKLEKPRLVGKWRKVGFMEPTAYAALTAARNHYGPKAKIRVEGVRLDVRPFYISNGVVVYDEYKPSTYSCGSSRAGKV